jgi:hypothetical protein
MFKTNYISGEKLGNLIFLNRVESEPKTPMALFMCVCGKQFISRIQGVKSGHTRSCGCFQKATASALSKVDYEEGQLIGSLILVKRTEVRKKCSYAIFRCSCGKEFETQIRSVKNGRTSSCGCQKGVLVAKANTIHGHAGEGKRSPEYRTWQSMWRRVTDPTHQNYERYKQLGVTICEEWKSFEKFLEDMGLKPDAARTLERVENNNGYYKENCRWATKKEQQRNKRNTTFVEYKGVKKSIPEWAELSGLTLATVYGRFVKQGWSIENTLTTPTKNIYPKTINFDKPCSTG